MNEMESCSIVISVLHLPYRCYTKLIYYVNVSLHFNTFLWAPDGETWTLKPPHFPDAIFYLLSINIPPCQTPFEKVL